MEESTPGGSIGTTPIGELMPHGRTYYALRNNGFWTVDDVRQISAEDWIRFVWFGEIDLNRVEEALARVGLTLPAESAPWVVEIMARERREWHGPMRQALRDRNGASARDLDVARYGRTEDRHIGPNGEWIWGGWPRS